MELEIKRFENADEVRRFIKGTFEVMRIGGMTVGRAKYEPGWKWSEHVGAITGTASCEVEHLGMVVSGRAMCSMSDGREIVMEPGDLFAIPPGHDSWVVGDEPYVSLHFLGASDYAAAHDRRATMGADALRERLTVACRADRGRSRATPCRRVTAVIRAATTADIHELARLRWQLYTEQASHTEPCEAYVERFQAFAREALAREDWRVWCAEEAGRLVAAVWLQTVPRVPAPGRGDPRPIGYLTNMYVEPDHRSRGLGSRMLRDLLTSCEASDYEMVLAFPASDAFGFYERNGFTRPADPVVHRFEH